MSDEILSELDGHVLWLRLNRPDRMNAITGEMLGQLNEELKAADDSHPIKKFKNPRMASYWEKIDARFCTSCHSEHEPEITQAGLLTLPTDYCVACHSEGDQDVRVNRPTHANLEFDTCASSGCHNYHDNKALYEDFLVKNHGVPWVKEEAIHPAAALAGERARPVEAEIATYLAALEAPAAYRDADAELSIPQVK